jgi:hypothetical protein
MAHFISPRHPVVNRYSIKGFRCQCSGVSLWPGGPNHWPLNLKAEAIMREISGVRVI